MKHDVVITSMEAIIPEICEQKDIRFNTIEDFFKIHNHHTCDVVNSGSGLRQTKVIGKHTAMLLSVTGTVFKDSCLDRYEPHEIGLFSALGMFDYDVKDLLPAVVKSIKDGILDYALFFKRGFREIYPLWPLTMLNNIAMCQCAIRYGIRGDNGVFSPHSDSSLNAIYEGWMSVCEGRSKAVIVGAVSEIITSMSLVRYLLCNTIGSRLGDIKRIPSYPLSEGAVAFCIEDIANTRKSSLCVLKGFGSGFGFDESVGGPSVDAIKTSMGLSLKHANLMPSDIDVIFSHDDVSRGEGYNEFMAIQDIFRGYTVDVVNSKSIFGDMLSCAGALDVVLGIKMILGQAIEPIFKAPRQGIKHVLINAMSVEGNVATLIIGRVP